MTHLKKNTSTSVVALYCHDCVALLVRIVSIHMKVKLALIREVLREISYRCT